MKVAFTLEAQGSVPDPAGGFSAGWTPLGTVWGELLPGSGRERGVDAVAASEASYRIIVRAAPHGAVSRPTPRHRFRRGSRIFRIRSVHDKGALARDLVCRVVEETAQ